MTPPDVSRDYPGARFDAEWRRLVFPLDYAAPEPASRYHLVVIGAGPAGLVTAIAAAGLGAKVALVERSAMGGDCLNAGCVPSKSLLEFTRDSASADDASADDFDAAFARLRRVRASIAEHDSVERYTAAGVDVFLGSAKFADQETVLVGHIRLRTRRTVIATGSRPVLPPIDGLAESRALTNETLFDLKHRPRRLAIIGGGPVGCEMAQAFARLGVEVALVESAERLLPRESPDASDAVERALRACGVRVEVETTVASVARRGAVVSLAVEGRSGGAELQADELLVATGRRANTDELNLVAVGVETDSAGRIVVDRRLRTANHRIYAAGDVCSEMQLTHNADAHARIVVQNALFVPSARADTLIVPRCTYTDPEVAQIGPLRHELDAAGTRYDTYRTAFGDLDRGRTQNDTDGFAEVLTEAGGGRILAATIVGRDAGEQIACIAIAMKNDIALPALGAAILPYPTRAEYVRKLADQYNRKRLTPLAKRTIGAWLRARK